MRTPADESGNPVLPHSRPSPLGRILILLTCTLMLGLPAAFAAALDEAEKAYRDKDFARALGLFRDAASAGDALAQFRLGTMYAKAQGVPQDYAVAANWFLKSATQGYAPAQNSLGVRYEKGQGVAQSYAQAAKLYREAAEQRWGLAQDNLADLHVKGQGVPQDLVLAYVWSSLASLNGESGAARKRVPIERALSREQLAEAQTHLGMMAARGRGVAQDSRRAVQWLAKAAAAGYVVAQFELAECLDKGTGVEIDSTRAAGWYEKAAAQGHVRAQSSVAYLYDIGHGVAADPALALHWYREAAKQGDAIAQYNLGTMYERGRGGAISHIDAHMWFNVAEVNGNATATESRRLIERLMTPADIAEAQRRAAEWLRSTKR